MIAKKIFLTFVLIILSISLASAMSISAPSQVSLNSNFDLIVLAKGFYALELILPQEFSIVSDASEGTRTGDLYKTVTIGSLTLRLRGIRAGTYVISGKYTDGSGIKDIDPVTIKVRTQKVNLQCPTCPADSEWSNCESGRQIKGVYICSPSTNYQCIKTIRTQSCPAENSTNKAPICKVGWICEDSTNLAYRSSDCSLSSIQRCSEGCEKGECKTKHGIEQQFPEDNLTIGIVSPFAQEISPSIFGRISNLIKRFIDFLTFWN